MILTAQAATDAAGVARAVLAATRGGGIPLAAAFVGGARVAPGVRALEEAGVPCYPSFARLAVECPGLAEIELNPLVATAAGAVAVDARGTLTEGGLDGDPEEPRRG